MSNTVFISYAHADGIQFAEALENWLESNEVNLIAFRDKTDIKPGDEWKKIIDTKIEECFVMLVVVTPAAIQSINVTYEWAYALGKEKLVIPLIIDSAISEDNLHPKMKDIQYVSFVNPTQEDWNKLKRQLIKIQAENDIPQSVINAVAGLSSHNPNERLQALESLKNIKHPAAPKKLKQAIQHEYPDVRATAGIFLAEVTDCKDDDAISGLREALYLSERDFDRAASLLIRMNNDVAAECLFSSYDTSKKHRKNKISDALVQFSDPCAVPYLRACTESGYNGMKNGEFHATQSLSYGLERPRMGHY